MVTILFLRAKYKILIKFMLISQYLNKSNYKLKLQDYC